MTLPKFPIAMGNLYQNAKPGQRAVDVAGAHAVAVGGGEWAIVLDDVPTAVSAARRDRLALHLTAGPGSNHSDWRGVNFGVSVMGDKVIGWIVTAYSNRSRRSQQVDAPISFVVYDMHNQVERPPCMPGCTITGHAGACVR